MTGGEWNLVDKHPSARRTATAARQRDILMAALDCFIENGFDATSLRQIAARANMTHAGVLHHFGSKEALVAALLLRRDEQDELLAEQFTHETYGVEGRAPGLFALLARNRQSPGEMRFWGELCAAASRPGHLSQVYFAARYDTLRAYMKEVLERRAEAGALKEGVEPELIAMLLPAVLDGLQTQWLLNQSIAIDRAVDHFLSLFLKPGANLADNRGSDHAAQSASNSGSGDRMEFNSPNRP